MAWRAHRRVLTANTGVGLLWRAPFSLLYAQQDVATGVAAAFAAGDENVETTLNMPVP